MNLAYPLSKSGGWLTSGNRKYAGSKRKVGVWNIPAFETAVPRRPVMLRQLRQHLAHARKALGNLTTEEPILSGGPATPICIGARFCIKGCFARQGLYVAQPVVYNKMFASLEFSRHPQFVEGMVEDIRKWKYDIIRIHSAGDFYSEEYRNNWFHICGEFPGINFWCYTKSVPLFMDVRRPANLRVIYSLGGKHDAMIDPSRHVHSRIFDSHEDLAQAGYADGTVDDALVVFNNTKIGLVYHGQKGRKGAITGSTTSTFAGRMGPETMHIESRAMRARHHRGLDQPGGVVDPSPYLEKNPPANRSLQPAFSGLSMRLFNLERFHDDPESYKPFMGKPAFPVKDMRDASRIFLKWQERIENVESNDRGGPILLRGAYIYGRQGDHVATVSQNGRVWTIEKTREVPHGRLLYDPNEEPNMAHLVNPPQDLEEDLGPGERPDE